MILRCRPSGQVSFSSPADRPCPPVTRRQRLHRPADAAPLPRHRHRFTFAAPHLATRDPLATLPARLPPKNRTARGGDEADDATAHPTRQEAAGRTGRSRADDKSDPETRRPRWRPACSPGPATVKGRAPGMGFSSRCKWRQAEATWRRRGSPSAQPKSILFWPAHGPRATPGPLFGPPS